MKQTYRFPIFVLSFLITLSEPAFSNDIPSFANTVREEALRSNQDPAGRPLPLVAHWHRNSMPMSVQIDLIKAGYPVLPWLDYKRQYTALQMRESYAKDLKTLRQWKLPLVMLTGGQWEADFYGADFRGLPASESGVGIELDGQRMNKVSPFSPISPWFQLGRRWTDNPASNAIQELYPDPPLVLFVSNNEANKLRWHEAESSQRFVELYERPQTNEFKRQVFGDGWIDRYTALFDGMRDGLTKPAWRENSRFIGYNSFAPDHWGRWWRWKQHSLVTSRRISPNWYMWQGAIVDVYDNHWETQKSAFRLWSMQTEVMNQVFMKKAALEIQPEFWLELIFWDGDTWRRSNKKSELYRKNGVDYTADLYGGWVQYALWILVPRVAREWRASNDPREQWWEYFQVVLDATKRIHENPVLTRFWRKGVLVSNPDQDHPFDTALEEKWVNEPRWFHLKSKVDDDDGDGLLSANYSARVSIWTLARVIGEAPNREWLVYSHAPLGNKLNVEVHIPYYRTVKLPSVQLGGSFYHLVESKDSLTRIDAKETSGKSNKL